MLACRYLAHQQTLFGLFGRTVETGKSTQKVPTQDHPRILRCSSFPHSGGFFKRLVSSAWEPVSDRAAREAEGTRHAEARSPI
jgi:hypothetical protein